MEGDRQHDTPSSSTNQSAIRDEENEILRLLGVDFGAERSSCDETSRNLVGGTSCDYMDVFESQNEASSPLEVLVPPDPHSWSSNHIRCWLEWAQKSLPSAHLLQLKSFRSTTTGEQLCSYSIQKLAEMCGSMAAAHSLHEHLTHLQRRVGGAKHIRGGAKCGMGGAEYGRGGAESAEGGAESLYDRQPWQSSSKCQ